MFTEQILTGFIQAGKAGGGGGRGNPSIPRIHITKSNDLGGGGGGG